MCTGYSIGSGSPAVVQETFLTTDTKLRAVEPA